jgi:outer membrane protein
LYNPAFTSYVGLQVYQPLLNGFGRKFNHRFLNLAENDLRFAYDSVEVAMTDALSTAASAYWDFVAFLDRQRVAARALALDQTMYDAIRQRIDVGVQAKIELATAALQVAASRRDLIIAQTNVQLQEVRLKSLMTKIIGPEIAALPFEPTDTLEGTMAAPLPVLDEALKSAGRKPPVREAITSVENHRIAEAFTRSNLRPTLSVIGEFSNHALAPGLNGMFRQVLTSDYPEYAIGFSLSFSVKNRAAQADNLRARLELKQAEAVLDQAKANMVLQIRTSITNLTPTRSQVEAAENAVAASQETADAEQERWNTGVSTLDKVYQTQVDLVRAQMAAIQSRLNYAKTLMTAESAGGTFLTINGITTADAVRGNLWKDPALK